MVAHLEQELLELTTIERLAYGLEIGVPTYGVSSGMYDDVIVCRITR